MANYVVISGNVVKDLERKNEKVAKTTLAHNRNYKKGDNWETETSFFELAVFGKKIEKFEKILKKGQGVTIVGRLQENKWTNKEGKKRTRVEIIVSEVSITPSNSKKEN